MWSPSLFEDTTSFETGACLAIVFVEMKYMLFFFTVLWVGGAVNGFSGCSFSALLIYVLHVKAKGISSLHV